MAKERPGAGDLVSIYEVLNETKGELFIGTTWRLRDLIGFQQMTPPKVVRHWAAQDKLLFRTIEYGIPNADAPAFIDAYRRSELVKRWRVLTERDAAPPEAA